MKFVQTPLEGASVIEQERLSDERGYFSRTFCAEEFQTHGLSPHISQCSTSFTRHRRTLRGLHYQTAPYEEVKLIRCTRGAIYDVLVDLRPDSRSYGQWFAAELTADNGLAIYAPQGVAHGFLTLVDDSEVLYQMSDRYVPLHAAGVRWDDPAFAITWPETPEVLSNRDRHFPDFEL